MWGFHRVSVSERINEAARGTARNMTVKRWLDEKLAAARVDRANPMLELPFRVYIAPTRTPGPAPVKTPAQSHNDIHNLGVMVLRHALDRAGFKVVNAGALLAQDEFINAAIETDARAILVSSSYGHAAIDAEGFEITFGT